MLRLSGKPVGHHLRRRVCTKKPTPLTFWSATSPFERSANSRCDDVLEREGHYAVKLREQIITIVHGASLRSLVLTIAALALLGFDRTVSQTTTT